MKYGKHPYFLIRDINLCKKAGRANFLWQPILAKAEADLSMPPILPSNPDGWLYEDLDRTKERVLRNCIVFLATGKRKYFDSMKKQLWCLIDEWPWIEKFHKEEVHLNADLRTGIIMFTLGLTYDWMYEFMNNEERRRVREAIIKKGFPLLEKDIKNNAFYLTSYGNNWLAVMLGGFAVAALSVRDEYPEADEIVELAVERTRIMADHVGHDGAWEEGPFYWGGIAFLIMFFDVLKSLPEGPDFLELDQLKKTCMFPLYMNMPGGGRANFSDANYFQDHNSSYLFAVMAKVTGNPVYQWAFHEYRNVAPESIPELEKIDIHDYRTPEETYQFITYDTGLKPEYPKGLPFLKVFQGSTYGFVSSRKEFGRYHNGLVLCANGGTNGTNHHQLDIGQVIMVYNKHNFINDPGYGRAFYLPDGKRVDRQNYFAKSSLGHNIITLDGMNQIDSADAKGFIEVIEDSNQFHSFKITMDTAYENCRKAVRAVKRNLIKDKVEIIDDFHLVVEKAARLAWFYNGEAQIIDSDSVSLTNGNSTCTIEIKSESYFEISLESYTEEGMLDRAGNLMYPQQYPYICINLPESKTHLISTNFTFNT